MSTVTVQASKTYTIQIEKGLLDRIGAQSASILPGRTAVLVTESNVAPLYAKRVEHSLLEAGFTVHCLVLPAGEQTKCLTQLGVLLESFAEKKLTRTDAVFALGGGVIGDLAGFAAAVYLRGIRYIQIPTTLLAAVDSSVGGKTAVDLQAGKNLAGAFHQPEAVYCDPDVLQTLPKNVFSDGCAEVIKYAILAGEPLYTLLKEPENADWTRIISECVSIKRDYVQQDEFDTGTRMFLNLGHTVGHAIEQVSGFAVSHGSAVAIGTVLAARLAAKTGLCEPSLVEDIAELESRYGLPTASPFPMNALLESMLSDKKRAGGVLRMILPERIGKCCIREYKVSDLPALWENLT